jgi:hypothetical protein
MAAMLVVAIHGVWRKRLSQSERREPGQTLSFRIVNCGKD